MALSTLERARFFLIRLRNRIIKVDLYGVRLFGVQFTPASVAAELNAPGHDFSPNQYEHNYIFKIHNVYVMIPKGN